MEQIVGLALEHEIADGELRIYNGESVVCFQWPLTFNWSVKLLRWHARQRLGILAEGVLPPALFESYGGVKTEERQDD